MCGRSRCSDKREKSQECNGGFMAGNGASKQLMVGCQFSLPTKEEDSLSSVSCFAAVTLVLWFGCECFLKGSCAGGWGDG